MTDLPLTGGCLCGAVRFEVTEPPHYASYCHCTRCQRRTGTAASAQARIVPGSLRIVQGADLVRSYVAEVRMQRALELLQDGSMPVRDVASSVGYRQPAQFAKTFRRHHGAPPSSFRGTAQSDNGHLH